jgi:hypothetical protein
MLKIHANTITDVNRDRFLYLDENGDEAEVCFESCNDNYKKKSLNREDMSQDDIDFITKSTCVGVRDITAKPPFIGLYSEPPVKIIFDSEEEFSAFRNKIHDLERTTLDLS